MRSCEGCGRETTGVLCRECKGLARSSRHFPRAGHPGDEPLEDCYDDESGPDDVCDDNPEHPYGKWIDR